MSGAQMWNESGQSVIEYALVVALVSLLVVGVLAGVTSLGMAAIVEVISAGLP